jgi:translocation and assembly module TamA
MARTLEQATVADLHEKNTIGSGTLYRHKNFSFHGRRAWIAAVILLQAVTVTARAADPQPYTLTIAASGNADLDTALTRSSQLATLRDGVPVGPFALVIRARDDLPRFETVLRSFGFYDGKAIVRIDGHDLDDPGLPQELAALPNGKSAEVAVAIKAGPQFHLREVKIEGTVSPAARLKLGLAPGQPAIAADVLAAQTRLLTALQEEGHAFAKVDGPEAYLDPPAQAVDVAFKVEPGPRVDIGAITLLGLHGVNEDFVRRRLLVHSGDLYQPSKIEAARQDLSQLLVFSGVAVHAAEHVDADGRLPLGFDLQERPVHSIGFTAAYSTDLGGIPKVSWSDRNLFGNAERLNLSAAATGLGGNASRGLGYNLNGQFIKPDFRARDQSLQFDFGALKQDLQAYNQTAVSVGASLHRKLNERWTASIGVSATQERILQEQAGRTYTLVGLPLTVNYDSTGLANPLLDPTHGVRATLSATPTQSFGKHDIDFVILQGAASSYKDLADFGWTKPGASVLALRGLVGSVQGASTLDLPPDQRFYGGGSGTVRGFKYQSIGPLFSDHNPIGGISIDSGTIEFRQRLFGDFGAVIFADAGQVNSSSLPFSGKVRFGAGGGLRYYTALGPIRFDLAVPVNRQPGGDRFEIYIGIGQAF